MGRTCTPSETPAVASRCRLAVGPVCRTSAKPRRSDVAVAGGLDHLFGDLRAGVDAVPSGEFAGPIPQELLVEIALGAFGLPLVGRPEARRIRGQQLVAQLEGAVNGEAQLDLCVGDDDALA